MEGMTHQSGCIKSTTVRAMDDTLVDVSLYKITNVSEGIVCVDYHLYVGKTHTSEHPTEEEGVVAFKSAVATLCAMNGLPTDEQKEIEHAFAQLRSGFEYVHGVLEKYYNTPHIENEPFRQVFDDEYPFDKNFNELSLDVLNWASVIRTWALSQDARGIHA